MEVDAFELTVKGKQLCNTNQIGLGIKCFETALMKGINDTDLVMAVHNELGNAYFSLKDYEKSLVYYTKNLNLSKSKGDIQIETMSHGNISSVLKMLGQFDEAIIHCDHHLDASRQLDNKLEIVKALYNKANIYYDNAKTCGAITRQDVGQFPPPVEDLIEKAADCYKEALKVNKKVNDSNLHSKILGNYANVHYLLNNFKKSIKLNTTKLKIVQDLHDKESERRTFVNRANVKFIIRDYESAIDDYKHALHLARCLKDAPNELKILYTIANTYFISKQFANAVESMLDYRSIVKNCDNKSCEARADLCLSIIYADQGNYQAAKVHSNNYCQLSMELGDESECRAARDNLQRIDDMMHHVDQRDLAANFRSKSDWLMMPMRARDIVDPQSINLPSFIHANELVATVTKLGESESVATEPKTIDASSDQFFALLSTYQMRQLKEQDCRFSADGLEEQFDNYISSSKKIFLDTLVSSQSRRLDDQRTDMAEILKRM